MQRWISVLLGLAVIVLAALLTAQGMSSYKVDRPAAAPDAGDGGVVDAADLTAALDKDASPSADDLELAYHGPDTRADGGIGSRMPDGTMVPPLPENAPKTVRFGIILVSYQGAQLAPPGARSKRDALELAVKLAGDARSDFHGAVKRGDDGSSDDVGRIPRGILELAPEYILFTLPPKGVSDPIDTPRGYWIVRRIE